MNPCKFSGCQAKSRLKDCCKGKPHCTYCQHSVCYTRTRCNPDRKSCHQFQNPHHCVANCHNQTESRPLSVTKQVEVSEPVQRPLSVREQPPDPEQAYFDYLMTHNRKYFEELAKLCCKKKPHKLKLDLKAKFPRKTVYGNDFKNKGFPEPLQLKKWPEYKGDLPFQKGTQYLTQYPQKPLPEKPKKQPAAKPEEKPRFGMSHYKHDFPKWGEQPLVNFKPNETTVLQGVPLAKNTEYKKQFEKKTVKMNIVKKPPSKPLNSGLDVPINTHYREKFVPWKTRGTESMRPVEYPMQSVPAIHHTEYKDSYIPGPDLNKCHEKLIDGFEELMRRRTIST